jgi:hypothetical protein
MITQAIINHIFEDVIPFLNSSDFLVNKLEFIEDDKPVYASVYAAKFQLSDKFESHDVILINLHDHFLFTIEYRKDPTQPGIIWLLSNIDDTNQIIIAFDEKSQMPASTKQQAQLLLIWENLVGLGCNWQKSKAPNSTLIALAEKALEI